MIIREGILITIILYSHNEDNIPARVLFGATLLRHSVWHRMRRTHSVSLGIGKTLDKDNELVRKQYPVERTKERGGFCSGQSLEQYAFGYATCPFEQAARAHAALILICVPSDKALFSLKECSTPQREPMPPPSESLRDAQIRRPQYSCVTDLR